MSWPGAYLARLFTAMCTLEYKLDVPAARRVLAAIRDDQRSEYADTAQRVLMDFGVGHPLSLP